MVHILNGYNDVFFCFKQKTAYEIKECDWSSDVCSSDLFYRMPGAAMLENWARATPEGFRRSEEHTSELQSHSFISYAVFCLKKKKPLPAFAADALVVDVTKYATGARAREGASRSSSRRLPVLACASGETVVLFFFSTDPPPSPPPPPPPRAVFAA